MEKCFEVMFVCMYLLVGTGYACMVGCNYNTSRGIHCSLVVHLMQCTTKQSDVRMNRDILSLNAVMLKWLLPQIILSGMLQVYLLLHYCAKYSDDGPTVITSVIFLK